MPARSVGRSPSPSRRGILSRIRSPFSSKARHKPEFYIQPDDPHRQYSPGDVVTGSVVLKVARPIDITHIVVCLHGFAQVYRSPNNPGEGYRNYNAALVAGKTNKAGGYYGNGFASLFEDEITLCGDGRLGEGTYQFNFELHFPRSHAPTSIDFERGTITYMITSTLTRPFRPTIITPTITCERRIAFVDNIDISPLVTPKPRVITLEPLPRRTRTKNSGRRREPPHPAEDRNGNAPHPNTTDSSRSRTTDSGSANGDADPPRSPAASEGSFESSERSAGPPSVGDSVTQSGRTNDSRLRNPASPRNSVLRRPIHATVEISKAGFLRGDNVEVRIKISHNKQVKSLHGVIVTLYRQARVDMHPALPIVTGKGDDDIYPKSRTGLGGLSLSAAGSCHLFRKDLDQSFTSLIINPDTLAQDIKASVRIPEDAFPTVSTVPGAMISFKYHVEVVLDLQGKLTGLDKYLGAPGPSFSSGFSTNTGLGAPGLHNGVSAGWGGHIINTEEIRREKNVVHCNFEIIVGTRDSDRNGLWKQPPLPPQTILDEGVEEAAVSREAAIPVEEATQTRPIAFRSNTFESLSNHPLPQTDTQDHFRDEEAPRYEEPPLPPPPPIPLPDVPADEELSEKERMKRAEERLLPSRPPDIEAESSSVAVHAPSAPALPDLRPLTVPGSVITNGFNFGIPGGPQPSAPLFSHHEESSSAPAYQGHAVPAPAAPTDDKQEMERRRLEMQRSAPPDEAEATSGNEAGPSAPPLAFPSVPSFGPSAPVLTEEDEFGFNTPEPAHALPRYER